MKKKVDISTMFTKELNSKCGRRGYGAWAIEKEGSISPKKFGEFLNRRKLINLRVVVKTTALIFVRFVLEMGLFGDNMVKFLPTFAFEMWPFAHFFWPFCIFEMR